MFVSPSTTATAPSHAGTSSSVVLATVTQQEINPPGSLDPKTKAIFDRAGVHYITSNVIPESIKERYNKEISKNTFTTTTRCIGEKTASKIKDFINSKPPRDLIQLKEETSPFAYATLKETVPKGTIICEVIGDYGTPTPDETSESSFSMELNPEGGDFTTEFDKWRLDLLTNANKARFIKQSTSANPPNVEKILWRSSVVKGELDNPRIFLVASKRIKAGTMLFMDWDAHNRKIVRKSNKRPRARIPSSESPPISPAPPSSSSSSSIRPIQTFAQITTASASSSSSFSNASTSAVITSQAPSSSQEVLSDGAILEQGPSKRRALERNEPPSEEEEEIPFSKKTYDLMKKFFTLSSPNPDALPTEYEETENGLGRLSDPNSINAQDLFSFYCNFGTALLNQPIDQDVLKRTKDIAQHLLKIKHEDPKALALMNRWAYHSIALQLDVLNKKKSSQASESIKTMGITIRVLETLQKATGQNRTAGLKAEENYDTLRETAFQLMEREIAFLRHPPQAPSS